MTRFIQLPLITALMCAPAMAHEGVKDPTVMARMKVMSQIGDATKVLGNMAKGKTEFDKSAAEVAIHSLTEAASQVTEAFTQQATDPKSEAKQEIWTNFPDFAEEADALTKAAQAADVSSLSSLRQGLGQIGQTCKSCHADYREKK